jgi:ferredoxin--NADP+ reductase
VAFDDLSRTWGFTAVVLACGAWRDRSLPVEGIDAYVDKGLVYQNPFIIAFNHAEDPGYTGPTYPIIDDAIVVGGGLASIDVVKVLMLETTRRALAERGHELDVEALEKAGLDKACEGFGLKWEDLGLKGSTLYYRREPEDMPLQEIPDDADAERAEKVRGNRKKMLERTVAKYRFRFEALAAPEGAVVEDGRLAGLVFRRMGKDASGKLVRTDETFERRSGLVISSIGSIPDPIKGVPMKGELFAFTDWDLGRLPDHPTVFSVGNVVTGKGNIVASRRHATNVGEQLLASYLGLSEDGHAAEAALVEGVEKIAEHVHGISAAVQGLGSLPEGRLAEIRARARARQAEVGFDGDLPGWIARAR